MSVKTGSDLITRPTLMINEAQCRKNIAAMATKASIHKLLFRPHFKTHQSPEVGEWFSDGGIRAITVSSVSMAWKFATEGWKDITIAFPFNIRESETAVLLAETTNLNVLFDMPEQAFALGNQLRSVAGYFIKINTGNNRAGLEPTDYSGIDQIISAASAYPLKFKGFLTHAGQTYKAQSVDEILAAHQNSKDILQQLKVRYKAKYPDLIVSTGDTPSCSLADDFYGIDEIRPGNFVFYDLMQMHLGSCSFGQISAAVICPVISVYPHRNEALIYGGAVHLSKEFLQPEQGRKTFGLAVPFQNNIWTAAEGQDHLSSVSQEHGILTLDSDWAKQLKPGDLVAIIPVHSCLAADLLGTKSNSNESF